VDVHVYTQRWLMPTGYTTCAPGEDLPACYRENGLPDDHMASLAVVAKAMEALYEVHETRFRYGPIVTTIYPASGSSVDFAHAHGVKYAYGAEMRPGAPETLGDFSYPLLYAEFGRDVVENCLAANGLDYESLMFMDALKNYYGPAAAALVNSTGYNFTSVVESLHQMYTETGHDAVFNQRGYTFSDPLDPDYDPRDAAELVAWIIATEYTQIIHVDSAPRETITVFNWSAECEDRYNVTLPGIVNFLASNATQAALHEQWCKHSDSGAAQGDLPECPSPWFPNEEWIKPSGEETPNAMSQRRESPLSPHFSLSHAPTQRARRRRGRR